MASIICPNSCDELFFRSWPLVRLASNPVDFVVYEGSIQVGTFVFIANN